MNPNNYCSLPVSKKLAEKGIVLETDVIWEQGIFNSRYALTYTKDRHKDRDAIPAPSMAELWRELPDYAVLVKVRDYTYARVDDDTHFCSNTNPADALSELLMWVKEEGNERR